MVNKTPVVSTFSPEYLGTYPTLRQLPNGDSVEETGSIVVKLLSEDPQHYPDAPREGIRRILEQVTGLPHPRNEPLDTSNLCSVRMGTTVATNALLERKGEPTVFVVSKGFKDLLHIGNQSRPDIFDLKITRPELLYQSAIEIDERVTLLGYQMNPRGAYSDIPNIEQELASGNIVKGISGEYVRVIKKPDLSLIEKQLRIPYENGIRSIAICFLHSFTYPQHEIQVGNLALNMGYTHASLSSQVMPMIKIVSRGHSATADGYLTPVISKYIAGFIKGFDEGIKDPNRVRLEFMQSDGGLTPINKFTGLRAILSGPAGGVVGYGQTTFNPSTRIPIIGLDIGGTSTDVSRYGGRLDHVFETTTAGIQILAPQLDINTVAAGGGSMLAFKNGLYAVGPESAGANPGPACYRKDGPLTITDANLVLGRLRINYFPKIFGKNENEELGLEASQQLFKTLAQEITENSQSKESSACIRSGNNILTVEEVASGFLEVACESVSRSIKKLTEEKGFETENHALAAFGGAGAQLACSVAKILGIKSVFVHRKASVLSAYGLSLAEVVEENQIPFSCVLGDVHQMADVIANVNILKNQCRSALEAQGFSFEKDQIKLEPMLNLRYEGTDTSMMIMESNSKKNLSISDDVFSDSDSELAYTEALRKAYILAFENSYKREFGFVLEGFNIVIDDIRVRATGSFTKIPSGGVYQEVEQLEKANSIKLVDRNSSQYCKEISQVYFNQKYYDTGIYLLNELNEGCKILGPAIILDNNSTIVVEPEWQALVTASQVILNHKDEQTSQNTDEKGIPSLDSLNKSKIFNPTPAQMSVFLHRFMSIAEQMGHTLQKTSISTNIKERLDFSCALFDPDGGLVANAPHIPVHLGSMSHAVRYQMELYGSNGFEEGDVFCTNHPAAGGTHLPDITIITPVFENRNQANLKENPKVLFFVASRGHHADIGGTTPGSIPSDSKYLYEEGAAMISFKIVEKGVFMQDELLRLLVDIPASYEGCSGCRRVTDVVSDLKAQIAANQRGIHLVGRLINEYSLNIVHSYMKLIQKSAENSVRLLLKKVYRENSGKSLISVDYMDDGTKICLKIDIDGSTGSAIFDFDGTGLQVYGNTNAPHAVTHSAVLYSLRCMIEGYLPLNQGCLIPIDIRLPENSILKPDYKCAVVGGNVLTSQRVVDVVFKAFNKCAASQGCTNNLTFGVPPKKNHDETISKGWGYYETIAGGHGAGPDWVGKSGVHTHITNTRITDPEILERRYPVLLREFSLRSGSGGIGKNCGGEGCVRDLEFLIPIQVSLLTERRVFSPYGLEGGGNAQRGSNTWLSLVSSSNESTDNIESSNVNKASSNLIELLSWDNKDREYICRNLGSKASVFVKPGDRLRIETPGGGAWGKLK
ncbi:hypothetical protein BB561_000545 [Smittium simulii]|uniref:5-oxoprolinase n=1 Tax=Smittium simulii TaxID=133385 RepID=A0A2T9YYM3_9FUNG|nr:hypothetical protein BB561_000545 [Smittium simulii]